MDRFALAKKLIEEERKKYPPKKEIKSTKEYFKERLVKLYGHNGKAHSKEQIEKELRGE